MNSTVGSNFKFFFFNKILAGPVNNAWDPLESALSKHTLSDLCSEFWVFYSKEESLKF